MAEFHPLRSNLDADIPDSWKDANREAENRSVPQVPLTKNLEHLHYGDSVYEPAEDTFLLIDAVCNDVSLQSTSAGICLEIGCGSGVVLEAVCRTVPSLVPLATDLNTKALSVTERTMSATGFAVQCDLAAALRSQSVDIMLFNPPYVPTPDEEVDDPAAWAWAGGRNGRKVVDRWIQTDLPRLLKRPNGVAYLVTVDDNRPHEIDELLKNHSLTMRPILRRRARNEYLAVQKITYLQ